MFRQTDDIRKKLRHFFVEEGLVPKLEVLSILGPFALCYDLSCLEFLLYRFCHKFHTFEVKK